MSVVSWGAPTLEFIKLAGTTPPPSGDWSGQDGYVKISGSVLLENSSSLETADGDKSELKNEEGNVVDSKQKPASYTFTTSVIKKKGEAIVKDGFAPKNGYVSGNWAMRLIPEDKETIGFVFSKCTIATQKKWSADQGGLDILNVKGIEPDTVSKEICEDYTASS